MRPLVRCAARRGTLEVTWVMRVSTLDPLMSALHTLALSPSVALFDINLSLIFSPHPQKNNKITGVAFSFLLRSALLVIFQRRE